MEKLKYAKKIDKQNFDESVESALTCNDAIYKCKSLVGKTNSQSSNLSDFSTIKLLVLQCANNFWDTLSGHDKVHGHKWSLLNINYTIVFTLVC